MNAARASEGFHDLLLVLVLLLVVLRLMLPSLVRDQLNQTMKRIGGFSGRIADVDLSMWRGAYRMNGLKVVKLGGDAAAPFIDAPVVAGIVRNGFVEAYRAEFEGLPLAPDEEPNSCFRAPTAVSDCQQQFFKHRMRVLLRAPPQAAVTARSVTWTPMPGHRRRATRVPLR